MHPAIHILSLISILSLTLGSLTGCGEKRVHVATVSGTPGQEVALEPIDENVPAQASGLGNESIDESALLSQLPEGEGGSAEPVGSAMTNEPVNMAHEFTGDDSSFTPLDEGQDFSTQSRSSGDHSIRLSNTEDFREPTTDQDYSAGLQDILSGEGIEPIPDAFQIAKAEPSANLQDQMNRIKIEEIAAAAAGLEDVYFQFDSWTLTQEGKQALERTLGWFEQDPFSNLVIEGHADQRGTQGYNMVLAKKRAVAVQDYLSQLGIDASRLAIISYGKDKPFCQDVTEVCYQLNRRGHLLVHDP